MIELIFLLVAAILFGAAALGIGSWGRVGFVPAGLFFLTLSQLWPHLTFALR